MWLFPYHTMMLCVTGGLVQSVFGCLCVPILGDGKKYLVTATTASNWLSDKLFDCKNTETQIAALSVITMLQSEIQSSPYVPSIRPYFDGIIEVVGFNKSSTGKMVVTLEIGALTYQQCLKKFIDKLISRSLCCVQDTFNKPYSSLPVKVESVTVEEISDSPTHCV